MLSPFTVLWLSLALLLTWSAPSVMAQAVRNKKRKEKHGVAVEHAILEVSNKQEEAKKKESPVTNVANPKRTGIRGSPVGFIECEPGIVDAGTLCKTKCLPSKKSFLGGLCEPNQLENLSEKVYGIARQLKGMKGKKKKKGGRAKKKGGKPKWKRGNYNRPTKRMKGKPTQMKRVPFTMGRPSGNKKPFQFGRINGKKLIHSRTNKWPKRKYKPIYVPSPVESPVFSPIESPVFSPVATPVSSPVDFEEFSRNARPRSRPTTRPTGRPTPRPTGAPTAAPTVARDECDESCVSSPGVVDAADQSCNGSSNLIVGCGSCNIQIVAGEYVMDSPCTYSPSIQVASGSCLYPSACGSSEGAVIGDESCIGYDTCSFAPNARIGDRSCDGKASCYATDGYLQSVTIGNDSCNGNLACTTQGGSMGVTIGSNSCNCDACCYNLGDNCNIPNNRCNTAGDCNFNNTASGGCPVFN